MWSLATAATASGDTTKTKIGSITFPSAAKHCRRVGVSTGGAGTTTLEGVSGLLEFSSASNPELASLQLPIGSIIALTSGISALGPEAQFQNLGASGVPVAGNSTVDVYVTMDMALTVNNTIRIFLQGD